MSRAWLPVLGLVPFLLLACFRGDDPEALRRILEEDRRAHLQTDASLLASHLADTLLSVDDGRISRLARTDVEARFRAYFDRATYHAWDDIDEPIVRLSPRRDMAWVVRQVRVDREQPGIGGRTSRRSFVSAWTATYEKRDGAWRMTSVASTFLPESATRQILAAARRRVGTLDAVTATALVAAPSHRFEVTVRSLDDGRARLDFARGPAAGIDAEDRWIRETPGHAAADLGLEMELFVRGHEVHMTLLAPRSRYPDLEFSGATTFASVPALRLTAVDALGAAVDLFYSAADTLPLGFQVADHVRHGPPPVVTVGELQDTGGVRLFRRATFRQAAETFEYRYTALEPRVVGADSVFRRPG